MTMSSADFDDLRVFLGKSRGLTTTDLQSISQLTDVQINEPLLDGQILKYNEASGKWTNVDPQLTTNTFVEGYNTQSCDGTTTTFMIPHGFGSTPTNVVVDPQSPEALDDFTILSKDGVNITLEYSFPPPLGTDNLLFYYRVS
jgi:hypothetical protein